MFSFICKPAPLLPGSPLSAISPQLTGAAATVTLPFPPPAPSPALAARWRGMPVAGASSGALYRGCPPSLRAIRGSGTLGGRGAAGGAADPAWRGGARVVPGAGPRGGGEGSVGGAGPRGGGAGAGAGRAHVTAAPLAGPGRGGAAGQRREAAGTAGRSVRCRCCCCCCCSATGTGGTGSGAGSAAGGAGPGMHNARPDEFGSDRVSAAVGTGRGRDGTGPPCPRPAAPVLP